VSMFLLEQPFVCPSVTGRDQRRASRVSSLARPVRLVVDGIDLVLPVLPGARRRILARIAARARARIRPFTATATSRPPQHDEVMGAVIEASVRHVGELVVLMRVGIWLVAFMTLGMKNLEDSNIRQLVFLYAFFVVWAVTVEVWGRRYPERFALYFLLAALAELTYYPTGGAMGGSGEECFAS
jgi:hypothetical protein